MTTKAAAREARELYERCIEPWAKMLEETEQLELAAGVPIVAGGAQRVTELEKENHKLNADLGELLGKLAAAQAENEQLRKELEAAGKDGAGKKPKH